MPHATGHEPFTDIDFLGRHFTEHEGVAQLLFPDCVIINGFHYQHVTAEEYGIRFDDPKPDTLITTAEMVITFIKILLPRTHSMTPHQLQSKLQTLRANMHPYSSYFNCLVYNHQIELQSQIEASNVLLRVPHSEKYIHWADGNRNVLRTFMMDPMGYWEAHHRIRPYPDAA